MKKYLLTSSSMLSIMAGSHAYATDWGFCNEATKLAYIDATFSTRKPEADRICSLHTSTDAGIPTFLNATQRCINSQNDTCDAASLAAASSAAGTTIAPSGFGDNNVPQNAWYAETTNSGNPEFARIRCSCGCFTPDTNILTEKGWQRIDVLKENGSKAKDRVLIPASDRGLVFKPSSYLKPIAFTKGPEEKPVIRIQTLDNLAVEMTELHPVPIKQGKSIEMVQAKTLKIGDIVYNMKGQAQKIVRISSRMLSKDNNSVYNLNTYGHGDNEHIIVANGIRVGDLGWQNKLAERAQRSENLLKYN